jgi:hypothetical protein
VSVRRFARLRISLDCQAKSEAGGDIDLSHGHTEGHVDSGPALGFEDGTNDDRHGASVRVVAEGGACWADAAIRIGHHIPGWDSA